SLEKLKWMDVGFDRENLAYASVNPRQAGYSGERVAAYADRLRSELARLPGVEGVGLTQVRLLSGNGNPSAVNIPGRTANVERGVVTPADGVYRNSVGEGFFETLHIPLLSGRTFEARDTRLNSDVVIVDEYFVRRFLPNQNPIGFRFGMGRDNNNRHHI